MRVALAQINSTVGDFEGNSQKIIDYAIQAKNRHCDVVVFPELALFGYWAADLLERETVAKEQVKFIKKIANKIPKDIGVLFGALTMNPKKQGRKYFNSAIFLVKGSKPKIFNKELLPTYDVFDEYRHFEFGDITKNVFKFKGKKLLVTICEDIWAWPGTRDGSIYRANPLDRIKDKNIDLVLNLSASPYSKTKVERRKSVVGLVAKKFKAPVVYVNLVGAQDEIIFDGGSFVLDAKGRVRAQSIQFEEDLNVYDTKSDEGGFRKQKLSKVEALRRSLVYGLQEFVQKNGFKNVHFGLSGGIDSAVVACLAVDALGPGAVSAYALPSEFNAPESETLAKELAKNLKIKFQTIGIQKTYEAASKSLSEAFGDIPFGIMHENLQARVRGLLMMAVSNHKNSLLLSTSNKSEYATGYSTLYGDMCGGLAPLGDLLKRDVYALAEYYNSQTELIPRQIIDRAPSAELRPNQKDQDTLPPYDKLDAVVENLVEKFRAAKSETDKWVLNRLYASEFKRWQAPPILRVTDHAFGRGRRLPITNKSRI